MREPIGRDIDNTTTQRRRNNNRTFFQNANLFFWRDARLAIRPAAALCGGILAARPIDRVIGIGRINRQQPPRAIFVRLCRQQRGRVRELGRSRAAPATRTLAAEAGIGQEPERRFHTCFPKRVFHGKHAPPAGIGRKFETRDAMRIRHTGQTINGRRSAQHDLHRRAGAGVVHAAGFAIHHETRFVDDAVANHVERDQLRGFGVQPAGIGGRPPCLRGGYQTCLTNKRKQRTKSHRGRAFILRRGGEPLLQPAERLHGMRNGGEQRIAVVHNVHAFAITRAMSHAPRGGGPQSDFEQPHLRQRPVRR